LCPRELLLGCEEKRMDEPIGSSPVSFSKRLQYHINGRKWRDRMDGTHKFEAIAPFGGTHDGGQAQGSSKQSNGQPLPILAHIAQPAGLNGDGWVLALADGSRLPKEVSGECGA